MNLAERGQVVWIAGNGAKDHQVIKRTLDGKFVKRGTR
jgi:hypothetical protein